jgi:predicted nucleic acid-binding protein
MPGRVLDTGWLIEYFGKLKPLAGKTPGDAESWADRLIQDRGTKEIVSPVEVEFLCVPMSPEETRLREAFLGRFRVIDDHTTLPADWEEARRLAKHVRFHDRPRKRGDCLIRAIAERKHREVDSRDQDFPRQHGRTSVGRPKPRKPKG